jgi:hypothetical protein
MGNFLGVLQTELDFLTKETEKRSLATVVKNDRQRWGLAQLWKQGLKKFIRESTSAANKAFYVPSSHFLEKLPTPSLQQLRDGIWQCKQTQVSEEEKFDLYVQRTSQFYVLKPVPNPPNKENYFSCTCYEYWKYATCKHSLGMSILKEKVVVPPQYLVDSLEQLKKRGRPTKVTNCMQKQQNP